MRKTGIALLEEIIWHGLVQIDDQYNIIEKPKMNDTEIKELAEYIVACIPELACYGEETTQPQNTDKL